MHCRSQSRLYSVKVGTAYDDLAKRLVLKLKFDGARSAVEDMAKVLAPKISQADFYLVPVPTATRRARQRGYDQAKLLARELSRQTGLPYLDCLRRHGQAHQVGSSRQQRLKQLQQSFRVTRLDLLKGSRILLVDDVLTTGSTLESAAAACRVAGAARVSAITFAQA
ncbi:MAG TPA: phosphoribosyltransferase family protein [Candidatus Saccharimonadales bacterium]|nr:phosphoribosyltransferase family protein [Candidatus Saccharimonadales bacterium]